MRTRRRRHRPISHCARGQRAVRAGYPPACCLSSFLAPETHTLYAVPRCPATCFLLSPAHALAGLVAEPLASLAMSVTHLENGVPGVPATCFLLSPWQNFPYALALLALVGGVDLLGWPPLPRATAGETPSA